MKIKNIVLALSLLTIASITDAYTSTVKTVATSNTASESFKKHNALKKRKVLRKSVNFDTNDFDDILVDDDVVFARNRRAKTFGQIIHEYEDDLSDYVKIRLALARMKALKKYQTIDV
jgi:histidinol phosphatase-like enzyme